MSIGRINLLLRVFLAIFESSNIDQEDPDPKKKPSNTRKTDPRFLCEAQNILERNQIVNPIHEKLNNPLFLVTLMNVIRFL